MFSLVLLASVYLNGVNVDGVRGQSFEKCKTVRIDEKGDVHLECPGYQVESAAANPAPAPVPAPPPLAVAAVAIAPPRAAAVTKRYWLVTEQVQGDAVQYDVDLFVNSKWIRKLKAAEDQTVVELTRHLVPGPNKLLFAASKHLDKARKSASPGAYLKIIVGEGEAGGNNVTIDNPLIELKRTAAETNDVNEEFTIQGR